MCLLLSFWRSLNWVEFTGFPGGDVALRPVQKESTVRESRRLHTTSPGHGWECEERVPVEQSSYSSG